MWITEEYEMLNESVRWSLVWLAIANLCIE